MINQNPSNYPRRLTKAGAYLANLLETLGHPVITQFAFYRLISQMYQEKEGKKLYLRSEMPTQDDYVRLRQNLRKAGIIDHDRDYGSRLIRVMSVSDLPADEIVCLADPICYVSHLSAMQRWG